MIRYSDEDLAFFKKIVLKKINLANKELKVLKDEMLNYGLGEGDDLKGGYKALEDGSATLEKEKINLLAARQQKFIEDLNQSLVRVSNKTYGVCRISGKLIPKERLMSVPHATLSIEEKNKQY